MRGFKQWPVIDHRHTQHQSSRCTVYFSLRLPELSVRLSRQEYKTRRLTNAPGFRIFRVQIHVFKSRSSVQNSWQFSLLNCHIADLSWDFLFERRLKVFKKNPRPFNRVTEIIQARGLPERNHITSVIDTFPHTKPIRAYAEIQLPINDFALSYKWRPQS